VTVDGVLVAFMSVSPDGIKQLRTTVDAPRVLRKMQQQVKFLVRQR
jgi:hypothetical protein